MDHACRLGGTGTGAERPRARLRVAGSEERAPPEQVVRGACHPGQGALAEAQAVEQFGALVDRELGGFRFQLHAHAQHLGGGAELRLHRFHQLVAGAHLVLAQVDDSEHGLVCEEEEGAQRVPLVPPQRRPIHRHAALELGERLLHHRHLAGERTVALGRLAALVALGLERRHVGQHQLELEGVEVGQGLGVADDVRVLESPQHEHHGVDVADAAEEAVAKALACGRSGHEGGDVDELHCGVHELLRVAQLGQDFHARVGDLGHTHVRFGGGEGVGGNGGGAAGEGIEQRRLSSVGKPDDAQALHCLRVTGSRNGTRRAPR